MPEQLDTTGTAIPQLVGESAQVSNRSDGPGDSGVESTNDVQYPDQEEVWLKLNEML